MMRLAADSGLAQKEPSFDLVPGQLVVAALAARLVHWLALEFPQEQCSQLEQQLPEQRGRRWVQEHPSVPGCRSLEEVLVLRIVAAQQQFVLELEREREREQPLWLVQL